MRIQIFGLGSISDPGRKGLLLAAWGSSERKTKYLNLYRGGKGQYFRGGQTSIWEHSERKKGHEVAFFFASLVNINILLHCAIFCPAYYKPLTNDMKQ